MVLTKQKEEETITASSSQSNKKLINLKNKII
nr:MAG TPA: hypothetical protein [Bacteriophage sp.]DAX05552.1 MAG TPA: hypothetical protein [Caudoviricetes sp.]